MNRRTFLSASASLIAGSALLAEDAKLKLKKAVKYGMIGPGKNIQEKFALLKEVGFHGVEIDSPSDLNLDDANAAQKDTGIKIHGVIDSVHWNATHALSHPDEKVRAKGLEALLKAIEDAEKVGADSVLLVPGVVRDETFNGKKEKVTYEQCYERSQAELKKAIPAAEKAKVKIAIEVVWNNFITKPEQLIQYVDDFKSEWVGAYFDCSNMLRYGVPSAEWIRKLGKRMLKFDFKGYSAAKAKAAKNVGKGFDVKVGEGDEDWPAIIKALAEVGYNGWATAEIGRLDEKGLRELSATMDRILQLK
jgi:L-ribulose-5-phosphate 3-epimerase